VITHDALAHTEENTLEEEEEEVDEEHCLLESDNGSPEQ
jgi:hypothetical protein